MIRCDGVIIKNHYRKKVMIILLLSFVMLANVGSLCSAAHQVPHSQVPTLFECCVNVIYKAKEDAQYQLADIAPGVAVADKKLCNKVLRHVLYRDGLSADAQVVGQLLQEGASLYPVLTLQGLIRDADINSKNHECPIDLIDPGSCMTQTHCNFMDMLQSHGFNFNVISGQKLVSRAIHNNNEDFVRYALGHGLYIPQYLILALRCKDTYAFNCMCKQICFKSCQSNCYKMHQSDGNEYHYIAKQASAVVNSVFFKAYAFRHLSEQPCLLDIMKKSSPVTHGLFAAGMTKNGPVAIYRPYALGNDWIVKTDSAHEVPIRMHECTIGDEKSYTFVWKEHILTLPYPSSEIVATLTRQKVDFDQLCSKEKQRLIATKRLSEINSYLYEDMNLELFYHA